jgi:15-cis-phytoene synthase
LNESGYRGIYYIPAQKMVGHYFMKVPNDVMSPPNQLSITYCDPTIRPFFSLLLAFDSRLRDVAIRNTEPLIAQLRLAWWRDAISADTDIPKSGEPLLSALYDLHPAQLASLARASMLDLLTAWEQIIVLDDIGAAAQDFAELRSDALFGGYIRAIDMPDTDEARAVGVDWALNDINFKGTDELNYAVKAKLRHRNYRPLTILTYAARMSGTANRWNGMKLSWHALTGRW